MTINRIITALERRGYFVTRTWAGQVLVRNRWGRYREYDSYRAAYKDLVMYEMV